ncbi:MAG: hypothetical protein NTY02_13730, partial [Acidobacteria bacterium]|nr:hypothetical protein [Acidobacteriota bacterium]
MSAGPSGAVVAVKIIPGGRVRTAIVSGLEPPLADGDAVILQTNGGPVLGLVVTSPSALLDRLVATEHTPRVVRRATSQDQYLRQRHEQRER